MNHQLNQKERSRTEPSVMTRKASKGEKYPCRQVEVKNDGIAMKNTRDYGF